MSSNDVRDDQLPAGAGTGSGDVEVVPAASTIVLQSDPFRVLLMRRHAQSSFVPGVWVFPGGVVEESDLVVAKGLSQTRIKKALATADAPDELEPQIRDEIRTMKVCAIRELFEEAGIWLGDPLADPVFNRRQLLDKELAFDSLTDSQSLPFDSLVWTARWITPVGVPKRFDTYFFLVAVHDEIVATPEHNEGVEMLWIRPAEALQRHRDGNLPMVFPTIRNLEAIKDFESAEALLESRRKAKIPTTRPVLVVEGNRKRIVLPEEE